MSVSDSVRKEVDELLTRLTKAEQHELLETLRKRFEDERAELRRAMLGYTCDWCGDEITTADKMVVFDDGTFHEYCCE